MWPASPNLAQTSGAISDTEASSQSTPRAETEVMSCGGRTNGPLLPRLMHDQQRSSIADNLDRDPGGVRARRAC
jgi:hypothetical protein